MGTLFSLVMMATYAQGYVVILIGTIVLLNLIILKQKYLSKDQKRGIINNFYNQQKENGTKETNAIFLNAMFTSWVSPCTVWASKLKFLAVSSSITLSVHLINLISLYLISDANLMNLENPPILHCFNSHKNFSNISYNYFYSGNLTTRIVRICSRNDDCLPLIRICSENEMPNTLMYTYIIPIAILLLFTSFSASLCLQILSNYTKMFTLSRIIGLACPKTFYWLVLDFVFSLDKNLGQEVLNVLEKGVTKNVLSRESLKKLFCHHCELFERSEETKNLYSKLEEISKENEHNQEENSKEIPQVVWKLPPMHAVVASNKFGLWCIMYILGGEAGALNGQTKSSINLIIDKSDNDTSCLKRCNLVSRHLIKAATKMYGKYALHKATQLGDIQLMQILIANGYNINETDNYKNTPLHISAIRDDLECLKVLIAHNADLNATDEKDQSPLHISAWEGRLECLKHLIDNKADVNAKDGKGKTPLHISAEGGHLECLKYLIENKADVNAKDKEGQTPLHNSAREGHLECLKHLIDSQADVNAKDDIGQFPLHKSALRGHLECIKYLIDNKADVNTNGQLGKTTLHISAGKGHFECLKYLIANKADVNAKDTDFQTPLHNSAREGHLECLKHLIDNKADVNAKDTDFQTPLHNSAREGHLECLKHLIDNKADMNSKEKKGLTPLHISAKGGHLKCLKYLIDKKADVNATDDVGQTPLHISAYNGDLECITYLIEINADVNVMDLEHNTPLHVVGEENYFALYKKQIETAEFLIKAGADLNASNVHGKTPMTNAIVKLLKEIKPELFIQKIEK